MLAAIISLLQDQVQPQPRKRTRVFDRGGGGALWPRMDIVDIQAALNAFQDVPGESPVARAARRTQHVGDYLRQLQEERESGQGPREATAFLWGATLAERAAEERYAEDLADQQALIADMAAQLDGLRVQMKAQTELQTLALQRAEKARADASAAWFVGGLVVGAIAVGIALRARR